MGRTKSRISRRTGQQPRSPSRSKPPSNNENSNQVDDEINLSGGLEEEKQKNHSLSKTAAAPIPLPMHMETTPYLLFLFAISWSKVAVHLAPVHPRGCPKAMAPPLTFTLDVSNPSFFTLYVAWLAKASLISNRSMSSVVRPAIFTASGMATAGPMPLMEGSTPTALKLLKVPKMGKPLLLASFLFIKREAAAPSEIWDAFPAVVLPSGSKAGLSFCTFSKVSPFLMPSSWLTTTCFSSPVFLSTNLG